VSRTAAEKEPNDFSDLTRLIRSIQRIKGDPDCFGTMNRICLRADCQWYEYCLKDWLEKERYNGKSSSISVG
jgi:hypothetical protein